MAEFKNHSIYGRWYKKEVARAIDNRAKEHVRSIAAQLNYGLIDAGYKSAINYYKALKNRFGTELSAKEGTTLQQTLTSFRGKVNRAVQTEFKKQSVDSMLSIFKKINKNSSNSKDLIDVLTDYFLKTSQNFQTNYNNCMQNISSVKKRSDEQYIANVTQIMAEFDKIVQELKQNTAFQMELYTIMKNAAKPGEDMNFDPSDMINKIIIPYYRKYLENYLSKNSKVRKLGKREKFAAGFAHEAVVYNAVYQLFKNLGVKHEGASGGLRDITLTVNGSQNTTQINPDDLLKQFFSENINKPYTVVAEKTYDDVLNNNNINIYGIQVKNASLSDDAMSADLTRFERISNHKELLDEFRNTVPLGTDANNQPIFVQEERTLDAAGYNTRIAQAITFLSETHRIIAVMGHTNIGYAEKAKFVWTSTLLQNIMKKKRYLSFRANLGFSDGEFNDFGSAVGIRTFLV